MKKKPAPRAALPTIAEQLEKLAMSLAEELRSPETPMDERIGGFKALTAYYAMINKLPQPADDTKGAFDGWANRLKANPTRARGNGAGLPDAKPNF